MNQEFVRVGQWGILTKVTNVDCSDGVSRTFHPSTGESDSPWTIPGQVYVKGRTVQGHIYLSSDGENRWVFAAYTYRKNGHLLHTQTA